MVDKKLAALAILYILTHLPHPPTLHLPPQQPLCNFCTVYTKNYIRASGI